MKKVLSKIFLTIPVLILVGAFMWIGISVYKIIDDGSYFNEKLVVDNGLNESLKVYQVKDGETFSAHEDGINLLTRDFETNETYNYDIYLKNEKPENDDAKDFYIKWKFWAVGENLKLDITKYCKSSTQNSVVIDDYYYLTDENSQLKKFEADSTVNLLSKINFYSIDGNKSLLDTELKDKDFDVKVLVKSSEEPFMEYVATDFEIEEVEGDSTKAVITGVNTDTNKIVIPSEYKTKTIVGIKDGALFSVADSLKELTIGGNIEHINNISGKNVGLSDEQTQAETFPNLETLIIKEGVGRILHYAFQNCKKLTNIVFNDNGTFQYFGPASFWGCTALEEISIPDNVSVIDNVAFANCSNLNSINFGEKSELQTIGESVFYSCNSLTEITIPASIQSIGKTAFKNCQNLVEVKFQKDPKNLRIIQESAFSGCTNLKEIRIPECVETLEYGVFEDCTNLETVKFGYNNVANLKTIGEKAFYNCSAIERIKIPTKVQTIGVEAFLNCSKLKYAYIQPETKMTEIKDRAFESCYNLREIVIPDSLEKIGQYVFKNCTQMAQVKINSDAKLKVIDDGAFYGCAYLRLIELPKNLEVIGNMAFQFNQRIEFLTLPNTLLSIGEVAFGDCQQIREINFDKDSNLKTIGRFAFARCKSLTEITLPKSIEEMGEATFNQCDNLISVSFEEGAKLKEIKDSTFVACYALKRVTIPASVEIIGAWAFSGCKKLESVTFEENSQLKTIKNAAFHTCESLKDFKMPSQVTAIGEAAFYRCWNLTEITIPETLISVGYNSFYDARSKKVIIENESFLRKITSYTSNGFIFEVSNIIYINKAIDYGNQYILQRCNKTTSGEYNIYTKK